MKRHQQPSFLSDIRLLLRAHGEQRWLNREVVPVLRELDEPGCIPEEQLGAALAYLEVHWAEARRRAAQTDAAHAELQALSGATERTLAGMARYYHGVVRNLRETLAAHVAEHVRPVEALEREAGMRADPIRFRAWRHASTFNRTPPTPTGPWRRQP
jgi:hypothetical protein